VGLLIEVLHHCRMSCLRSLNPSNPGGTLGRITDAKQVYKDQSSKKGAQVGVNEHVGQFATVENKGGHNCKPNQPNTRVRLALGGQYHLLRPAFASKKSIMLAQDGQILRGWITSPGPDRNSVSLRG